MNSFNHKWTAWPKGDILQSFPEVKEPCQFVSLRLSSSPFCPNSTVCHHPDVQLGLRPLWCCHIPAKGQGSVSSACSPSLSPTELIMGSAQCLLVHQHHKLFCCSLSLTQQQASLDVVWSPRLIYHVNYFVLLFVAHWQPAVCQAHVYKHNLSWLMLSQAGFP